MRKIAVVGPVGAGKSHLANELGKLLGIRVLHLDALFWNPGWVATPPDEWEARQRLELAADSWIAEAQFDDVLVDWFREADTVVFVDAAPLRCLWRVARRRLNRQAGVGTPAGSEPGPSYKALAKFVRNQWHYRRSVRKQLLAELAREEEGRLVVVVRRRSDADAFLSSVDSPR
jgi:adenylate kinase family enzyme